MDTDTCASMLSFHSTESSQRIWRNRLGSTYLCLRLEYQRRWRPVRTRNNRLQYEDHAEVEAIFKKYHDKMYVFIAPSGKHDRRTRDIIGISFVRLAQQGNSLARQELIALIKFTIDNWIERYSFLSRWRGYEDEVQTQLEACIRRYR